MRLAVTGTHGVGKTTLIDDFVAAHPGYESEVEPYWALAQRGVAFANGPTTADLEEQLAASCGLITGTTGDDIVFDRCPLDFIGYLEVLAANEGDDWSPDGRLLSRIEKALHTLDLVVFLPIQQPDEITVAIEHPRLRARVDRRLKTMLRDDDLGLLVDGPKVVEISGTREERVRRLTSAVAGL